MSKDIQLINRLFNVEKHLNEIKFKDISIGGLFADFLLNIYLKKREKQGVRHYFLPFKWILDSIFKHYFSNPIANNKTAVFITKVSDKEHINRLIDPLAIFFSNEALIISAKPENYKNNILFNCIPRLSIKKTISCFLFSLSRLRAISKIFKLNGLSISTVIIFNVLLIQILRLNSWMEILKLHRPKLVLFDADRYNKNSPLALSALSLKIKTVTLVHGVISPSYGYTPLIVDQIWCWGNFQKRILINKGVPQEKIKITGNPIAKISTATQKSVYKTKKELKLSENKKIIGVAINPLGIEYNSAIINLVINAIEISKNNSFLILLKLHPSQNVNDIDNSILNNPLIVLYDNSRFSNSMFFPICDLLLLHNSGIGYEAILNNLPVGIVDNIPFELGNGEIMIEHAKCPVFKSSEELSYFLEDFNEEEMERLLHVQKDFVLNEYYFKIGESATNEIVQEINSILKVA